MKSQGSSKTSLVVYVDVGVRLGFIVDVCCANVAAYFGNIPM